ncbi:MAG: hypothetical protein IPP68_02920 [Elusimicrobia bacterium]|nr:hypothetical protein [Elusimicrobiota bacterium]
MATSAGPVRSWAGGVFVGVVLVLLYFVYRAFPDALRNYDGLMFSSVISEESGMWRSEMWAYGAHYLFNPVAWVFHKGLLSLGVQQRGFVTVLQLNAMLASLTVAVVWVCLKDVTNNVFASALMALVVGHSFHFWSRAVECSVYALHLFSAAMVFWSLWRERKCPTRGSLFVLGLSLAVAVLTHISTVFWAPGVALAVGFPNRWKRALVVTGGGALAVFLLFSITYGIHDLQSFIEVYRQAGRVGPLAFGTSAGQPMWAPRQKIEFLARGLLGALWALPRPWTGLQAVAAFGALGGAAGLLALIFRRTNCFATVRENKGLLLGSGLSFLGVFFLQWVLWADEETKFSVLVLPVALAVGILARPLLADKPFSRSARSALLVLWIGTFVLNLTAAIVPGSRLENNPALVRALFVRAHTPPNAVVLINGGFLRLYLPGNAGREAVDLAYPLILTSKSEAMAFVEGRLRSAVAAGRPVFAVSEVVDRSRWPPPGGGRGLDTGDHDRLLAPFEVAEAARLSDWSLYALRPRPAPGRTGRP